MDIKLIRTSFMAKLLLLLAMMFFTEAVKASEALVNTESTQLSVATYNIHSAINNQGEFSPALTLQVLESLSADVIALQEVGTKPYPERESTYLSVFANTLGMQARFGASVVHESHEYGNALLSRYPIIASRNHVLYEPAGIICSLLPGVHRRSMLEVDLQIENKTLRVFVTHLGLLPWERASEFEAISRILEERKTEYSLLMGDFNEWFPNSGVNKKLDTLFYGEGDQVVQQVKSIPVFSPIARLDRIYFSSPEKLQGLRAHRTELSRKASDHLPVSAKIILE